MPKVTITIEDEGDMAKVKFDFDPPIKTGDDPDAWDGSQSGELAARIMSFIANASFIASQDTEEDGL